MVAQRAGNARKGSGSPALVPAHYVRFRDDQAERLLPWHRELLAAFLRTTAGRSASDAARLSAERRAAVHRREPPDDAAIAGHVSWRPVAEGCFGGIRFSAP